MHTRSRRSLLVVPILALALGACTPAGGSTSPNATAAVSSSGATTPKPTPKPTSKATSTPAATPAPSKSAPTPASSVTQTDTEWGRIWDALPAGFPRYPGATTADDATAEPVSAAYAVAGGDAAKIAAWMQTKLEQATYSTEGLSGPYEDGSLVLDSVGAGDCHIQTKIAPQGGLILVTVLYGAACPA